VPNFGAQSPELAVTCRAGKLSGRGRADIVTRWQQAPGFWGPPGYPFWPGDAFAWGWGGWGGPGFPISDYPDVGVLLN
jgi:hypothetical protein